MSNVFALELDAIRQWMENSWFSNIKNSPYQEALRAVILQLWPARKEAAEGSRAYTFLNVPALCYRSLGGTSNAILPINCAWIFLYAAFYLLDKVEDQETGHPLFHQLGQGPVTNLTTGLILNAGAMLSSVDRALPEMAGLWAIQSAFFRVAAEVCAGQHLDLTLAAPDFETAWAIAVAKSGQFFSLGCQMGAGLSAAAPEQVEAFASYGRHLGTLIQITNDYEGLFPNKEGNSDIITGKHSLPISYCFHVLPEQEKILLQQHLSASACDMNAKQQALQMIIQSGALVYLYLEAEKQKTLATQALEPQALVPEVKEILLSIPEKMVHGMQPSGN